MNIPAPLAQAPSHTLKQHCEVINHIRSNYGYVRSLKDIAITPYFYYLNRLLISTMYFGHERKIKVLYFEQDKKIIHYDINYT